MGRRPAVAEAVRRGSAGAMRWHTWCVQDQVTEGCRSGCPPDSAHFYKC